MSIAINAVLFVAFVFVVSEFLTSGLNINPRPGIDYIEVLN